MNVALISPAPIGREGRPSEEPSEEPLSAPSKRELKAPTFRSVKFCSITAVEEADLVVAISRMVSGGAAG